MDMNRFSIFKSLLPALLPLVVFIIADEIWGTTIGIIVAVIFGIGEFIFTYLKEKRIDKFILTDTLLLVILGGISLMLDNAIFFKLKPALIEALFCAIIAFSAFSKKNILLLMSQRYMKNIQINPVMEHRMKISMRNMFWLFSFHTLIIIYAAFFMSEKAWAFISTALFYILAGFYFIFDLFYWRYKAKSNRI